MDSGQRTFADEIAEIFIAMHPPEIQDMARNNFRRHESWRLVKKMRKYVGKKMPRQVKMLMNNLSSRFKPNRSDNWLVHTEYLSSQEETGTGIYWQFHKTTLPTILRNFDRASMGNGIEIRMPFMDWRLVSFVFHLPLRSKVGGGYTKRILRDVMSNIMPESIRTRKMKIGLNAPMIEWFSKELRELILKEVNSKEFLESDIWNGPVIRDFVDVKMKTNSWTWDDCIRFWPYLNAHILITGES